MATRALSSFAWMMHGLTLLLMIVMLPDGLENIATRTLSTFPWTMSGLKLLLMIRETESSQRDISHIQRYAQYVAYQCERV